MSAAKGTPAALADVRGCLARVHIAGGGCYASERTTLDHAKEIVDRFVNDLWGALQPGALPVVPFPASGARIDVQVIANRVSSIEVVRVNANGVVPC